MFASIFFMHLQWRSMKKMLANIATPLYTESTTQEVSNLTNQELLDILRQGPEVWNAWRKQHPEMRRLDLSYTDFGGKDSLRVNRDIFLSYTDLSNANLYHADLSYADLSYADLSYSILYGTNLSSANLNNADLSHTTVRFIQFNNIDLR